MPDQAYRKTKNKSGRGLQKFLGELELAVMEIVWQHETITVAEVLDELNTDTRQWAYTTVMTIMSRLAEKGWLVAEKKGKAFSYRASSSRDEAEARVAGEVVRALLEDFGEVAITQF